MSIYIYSLTNDASAATLTSTAATTVNIGITYALVMNRRPSDGRFTTYIFGGTYTSPILLTATGGSNPSAGDVTYMDSKWISVNLSAGDKLLMWDPQNPGLV